MKALIVSLITLFAVTLVALPDAQARRFGGGMSLGKQYKSAPPAAPRQAQQSAPTGPQSAARPSGASRWLGPLAGLAAGGLLASLFFGDAFEGLQIMDILLFAALIFGGIMLFKAMRRGSAVPAGAGSRGGPLPGGPIPAGAGASPGRMSTILGGAAAAQEPQTGEDEAPDWFDSSAFVEGAKTHFIRLQAAWDKADFRDIREYTTPQLFAELQRERAQLGDGTQYTEAVRLDAEIAGVRRDGDQVVASILFSGLIREEAEATAQPFREVWHVQHDWDSSAGDWLISGVQQEQA